MTSPQAVIADVLARHDHRSAPGFADRSTIMCKCGWSRDYTPTPGPSGPGRQLWRQHLAEQMADRLRDTQAHTVTTLAELDALPVGTVVLDADGETAMQCFENGWPGLWGGHGRYWDSGQIGLPATVLYRPAETQS